MTQVQPYNLNNTKKKDKIYDKYTTMINYIIINLQVLRFPNVERINSKETKANNIIYLLPKY